MIRMIDVKKAEEILRGRVPSPLKTCFRLAELEKDWQEVVGSAAAERSSPVSCEFSEEGLSILIHADSPVILPALRSRKSVISKSICRYLGVSNVKIEIKVGKVTRPSCAKDPLPEYLRRAPVLISENALRKNLEEIEKDAGDDELAENLARLKTVIEKKNSRKK